MDPFILEAIVCLKKKNNLETQSSFSRQDHIVHFKNKITPDN